MGLSGQSKLHYFCCSLSYNWDSVLFSHKFLIVPDSASPLLGRDILSKALASVFMNMETSLSLQLIEQNVNLRVWADGKTGLSTKCCSCCCQAERSTCISMYPLKPKVKKGLKSIIDNLKEQGLLIMKCCCCELCVMVGFRTSGGEDFKPRSETRLDYLELFM